MTHAMAHAMLPPFLAERGALRRLTADTLLLLVPLAMACSTVVGVRAPAAFIAAKAPRIVWVTKSDNTVLRLQSPEVIADTLVGFLVGGEYVEVPLSSVQSMRARQDAPGRTVLLLGGLTVAGAIGIYLSLGTGPVPCTPSPVDRVVQEQAQCPK